MKATCGYFLFSQLYVGFHQDYNIFSRGSKPKPSFATGILGGGTTQLIKLYFHVFFFHLEIQRSTIFHHISFDFPRKCLN